MCWTLNHQNILEMAQGNISLSVDKFHDFLSLFVFYKIFKQLDGKFTAMLSEHGAQSFRFAPEVGRNLC
jgi:hypothetical protein